MLRESEIIQRGVLQQPEKTLEKPLKKTNKLKCDNFLDFSWVLMLQYCLSTQVFNPSTDQLQKKCLPVPKL